MASTKEDRDIFAWRQFCRQSLGPPGSAGKARISIRHVLAFFFRLPLNFLAWVRCTYAELSRGRRQT
jgi:hypothetical protein